MDTQQQKARDTVWKNDSLNPDGSLRDTPYPSELGGGGGGAATEAPLPENLKKDRAAAHADLAKMFQVSDKYGTGAHKSNQLTPEQFDEVCALYSDIRMGQGAISLHSEEMGAEQALKFKADMMRDIATMLQTDSGRDLLGSLHDGKHKVKLHALHADANGNHGRDDDGNAPLDTSNAMADAALPNEGYAGGHGSDVDVRFNPGLNNQAATPDGGMEIIRADTTLFHELVHTYHQTHASTASGCATMVPEDMGDSELEHQAIGIGAFGRGRPGYHLTENAYREQRRALAGATGTREGDATMKLRTSHSNGSPIERKDYCGGPDAYDKDHAH